MRESVYTRAKQRAAVGMELAEYARLIPERFAVQTPTGALTYAELNAQANRIANFLRSHNVGAGDHVALLCCNRLEFVVTRFATYRMGVVLTPVNWHLLAEDVAYIVDNCDAKALFADTRVAAQALLAAEQCPQLHVKVAIAGEIEGFVAWQDALDSFSANDISEPSLGGMMLYTSGTTGRPKGVVRKQPDPQRVADMVAATITAFRFDPDGGQDLALNTGPLYHTGPFNLTMTFPIIAGVGTVLMDKWDAEQTLRLIEEKRISHTFLVPTMFQRLLELPQTVRSRYDTSSLKFVLHSAAPCPPVIKQQMLDWWGPVIWEMMATTEGPGTMVSPQEWLAKPGTLGKPQPGQIRVLDEQGNPLGQGEEGMLYWLNPPSSQFEYHKDAEKTKASRKEDYFTAGDIGYLDEDGYLFLTGRSAETIIAGGVNIYPQEIDNVLMMHPAVEDVACVGIPNPDWGEEIKAVVKLRPDYAAETTITDELLQFAATRLAKQKWPRSIDYVDALPRSETGKLLRKLVRDGYWPQNQKI